MNPLLAGMAVLAFSASAMGSENERNAQFDNPVAQGSPEILDNEEMRRLHADMTLGALSEAGMEARRKMIGSTQGRAYHRALERVREGSGRRATQW